MFTPLCVVGMSAQRDADVFLVAQELVGIEELERDAQDRRDRAQRDVALLPGHADADDFLALVHALADDAEIGNGARIGTRIGVGEREARESPGPWRGAAGNGSSAPRCRSGSATRPGPSELGTITVTAAVPLRVEILVTISEWA